MNQQQKNYIKKRVGEILNLKMGEARETLTAKPKTLSNVERARLIRSGKVKLKSDSAISTMGAYNSQLTSFFDFSKFEKRGGLDNVKYAKHCKALRAKANEITDKVMLGDAEEALKMIREFEAFEI